MSGTKITELVDQKAIDDVKRLSDELKLLLDNYTDTAKELAKGVDINVRVIGDIDKLEKLFIEKSKEAAAATERLNGVIAQQRQVIDNTTNTISRHLMEQERVNKTQREAYTEYERVKQLLDHYHDTYDSQLQSLVKLDSQLKANRKEQSENEKALAAGKITMQQFTATQTELIAKHRALTQEKRTLNQLMTAEEKASQSAETSYVHMSQQLELLKKAYKGLSAEGRESDFGKDLENAIQNLDAHLKDTAADMGEFQRNVGNYAIAGRNGVVSTESLISVLEKQAFTMQDVADQSKILEEAKRMLDKSDGEYSKTIGLINDKLNENRKTLTDVSDIIGVQAKSVAEAEAQNKRLREALKLVDQTSDEAKDTIAELSAKIEENDKVIEAGSGSKASLKKDLKDLVLEIANLSIEYQNLSEEEKASAEGQALASHITDLTEKAGELKDAIADTNAAITNAASDTRTFDQLGGAIQLAIDGFGLAQGAAAMLGISEEELAEVQTKLQAAIAASNAMQSIQNSLQSQSALMQGVNLVQTRLRTIAENLHTAAQGKGVVATNALTVAQWAFNAAANANPIGLLVVGITAAIAAVWGLVKAFEAVVGTSKDAEEEYRRQKEALDDLSEAHEWELERLKELGATEATLHKKSLQLKQEQLALTESTVKSMIIKYGEDSDAYKKAVEDKEKAEEEFQKAVQDSKSYLNNIISDYEKKEREQRLGTYEYKRQLIAEELDAQKALTKELYLQGELILEDYNRMLASLDKVAQFKTDKVNEDEKKSKLGKSGGGSRIDAAKKEAEELKKAVQAGEDALLNLITDSLERQRQTEILSYERQLKELQEKLSKTRSSQVEMRKALSEQIEGLQAQHEQTMHDLEISGIERSLNAESDFISSHLAIAEEGSERELELKKQQLDNQYRMELLALQKSEEAKLVSAEQAEEMRVNLAIKYSFLRDGVENDHAAKHVEMIQAMYASEQTERDNALLSEINDQKSLNLEKLKAAKGNAKKLEEIERDYQRKCIEIEEKYAEESARKAIGMLEATLLTENLSAEDRERIERELAKAKMDFETMMADHAIAQGKRVVDYENDRMEKRKEAIAQWLNVASTAISNVSDLIDALHERQIQKIEDELDANTEAGEKEQERITELVEKKVITEEEGEARKRAAEALTARKNEELEKKKADLQHRQAVYQKATDLAQAGIATALAITQALPNLVLAAIAGAMGAVQIATILATPIPKYAKGTDYHRGGPAIVGDGGRQEIVLFNGGAWLTPDKPTLVDIPAGAVVLPDVKDFGNDLSVMLNIPENMDRRIKTKTYDDSAIRQGVSELISQVRMQTRQQHMDAYLTNYEIFKNLI